VTGQLHLTPQDGAEPYVRVPVSEQLAKLVERLEPSARAELEQRLPIVVRQAFDAICEVRSLSPDELAIRLVMARRDVERFVAEMERRASRAPAG
jgi:hypothetical protein